ncbi:hypothetical protein CEXT_327361 [Caerostris extrusa]|uniref:Uncharacterized protein n=1 Tax=Caerostris extrusa TaxID=172846 RepID=A0AAV4TP87_CAEEX|nr:hypothetical protein CEXT_327361 [Caerostris extrusa]
MHCHQTQVKYQVIVILSLMGQNISETLIIIQSFALNRYQNVQLLIFHHLVLYNDLHRLSGRLFLRSMVCPSVPTGSHLSGLFGGDGFLLKLTQCPLICQNMAEGRGLCG